MLRYRISSWIIMSAFVVTGFARASTEADINTLLRSGEPDKAFNVLGILTLNYTFNDLLGSDISLKDMAASMTGILDIVLDESKVAKVDRERYFPGTTAVEMKKALEGLVKESKAAEVTWAKITKRSHQKGDFAQLYQALEGLEAASLHLPFMALPGIYLPGRTADGDYYPVNWFLKNSDLLIEIGTWRYFDLLTREVCEEPGKDQPCDLSTISPDTKNKIEVVQMALQLGMLRVKGAALGVDCCNGVTRTCDPEPELGCSHGTNGYCKFGSIFCP